jgi:hypothetical protein
VCADACRPRAKTRKKRTATAMQRRCVAGLNGSPVDVFTAPARGRSATAEEPIAVNPAYGFTGERTETVMARRAFPASPCKTSY